MSLLIIETATERSVIAIVEQEQLLFLQEFPFGTQHSKYIVPAMHEAINSNKIDLSLISAVAVGTGPGSFTGIRVGVSIAQAFAYARKLPLFGISSLKAFIPKAHKGLIHFATVIDAKIGGVYLIKGEASEEGIYYTSEPRIHPLIEMEEVLNNTNVLITPFGGSLQEKLSKMGLSNHWIWEESAPSPLHIASQIKEIKSISPHPDVPQVEILYLSKTY